MLSVKQTPQGQVTRVPIRFVSYIRVSTVRQGQSGLGLEAQQVAVASYARSRGGDVVAELREVESGRKGAKGRPELAKALAQCKKQCAALVIGKLDRLARDVRFFLEVIDDSGVDIRFADMPDICPSTDEGRMMLISMANFAEFEGRRIGTRTKAALAAAKKRGVVLGVAGPANLKRNIEERQAAADAFAGKLAGLVAGFKARGLSQRRMVEELNLIGVAAPRGGSWKLAQVQRLLSRLDANVGKFN